MHSLNFWMYLVDVGMATDLVVNPSITLMGSQGCLPYMKKYELKPVVEIWVQFKAWTNAPILPIQSDLHLGGSVPNTPIRVELNISHWPFV